MARQIVPGSQQATDRGEALSPSLTSLEAMSAMSDRAGPTEMTQRSRWLSRRSPFAQGLISLLTRRNGANERGGDGSGYAEAGSPKTPRFAPERLHIPFFHRHSTAEPASTDTQTRTSVSSPSSADSPPLPTVRVYLPTDSVIEQPLATAQAGRLPTQTRAPQADSEVSVIRGQSGQIGHTGQGSGLTETSRSSRWRQQRQASRPKFLFCFPYPNSHQIRSHMVRAFVSGLFLLLLVVVYVALSVTKNVKTSEFTILLILIIIFTTIILCHSLVRLCMLVTKRSDSTGDSYFANMTGSDGYAVPQEPIPVVLARDEEAAGSDGQAPHPKPPAYGLWRESVRVDPNRLFWRRNDGRPSENSEPSNTVSGSRPPSYVSEDGVSYVVEVTPRSTVSTIEVPLPPHPSERPVNTV